MHMASVNILDDAVSNDPPNPSLLRPWGFWATLAWLVGACAIGAIASVALDATWREMKVGPAPLWVQDLSDRAFDFSVLIVLVAAVLITRLPVRQYLALVWPCKCDVLIGLACVAAAFAADEVGMHVFGLGITDYQDWVWFYRAALANGTLPLFWFNLLIVGPVGEEIVFRGFLYQGWSQSRLGTIGTILLTSVLFGLMHWTYSWIGIFSIFYFGLLVGWLRWRSGSLLVPMLVHFVCNLLFLIEVAIDVHRG